jgi:hypothetical protein
LHFAVAPVGSVLPAVAVGADLVAVAVLAAGAGVAAGADFAAGAGVAAAAGLAAFCTPPWPLQVPLPVEVLVVPSLQVVVTDASSAHAATTNANVIKGAAIKPASVVFFIRAPFLVLAKIGSGEKTDSRLLRRFERLN